MSPMMKNNLALILGVFVGGFVNLAIIAVGPSVIPLPEGVDLADPEKFSENLKLLKPANFIAPLLAHALGSLVGAFVTGKLAVSYKMTLSMFISVFFMFGGIMMVMMYGGPTWFAALDLIGAYLPMGYLGGVLAGARRPKSI